MFQSTFWKDKGEVEEMDGWMDAWEDEVQQWCHLYYVHKADWP